MLVSKVGADQAAGLRRMIKPKPVRVIAITSGKGGVGKTNLSVNLGVAMAKAGHDVMLMDADLGLANVDVVLGLHPPYDISHVLKGERTLEEIIVEGPECLMVAPAASSLTAPSMAGRVRPASTARPRSAVSGRPDAAPSGAPAANADKDQPSH